MKKTQLCVCFLKMMLLIFVIFLIQLMFSNVVNDIIRHKIADTFSSTEATSITKNSNQIKHYNKLYLILVELTSLGIHSVII